MDKSSISCIAEVLEWRGPAPFFFARLPADCLKDQGIARSSYGWGCVAVDAMIDGTHFQTSLIPREGTYYLPLRNAVRREIDVVPGDTVNVTLAIRKKAD